MVNVNENDETYPPAYEPKKSRGCLFGCLIAVGLVVALMICAGVGGWWFVSNQVAKYTSETPVELPKVALSDEELTALENRLTAVKESFDREETPDEDLVLTADEINALINKQEGLQGRVFVKVNDGKVSGDVSFPVDRLPGGKGRYFNGSAGFNVSMQNGVLIVTLAEAEVNGEPVPQQVIDAMAGENLAKDAYKDADNAKVLRRIEDLSIEDDTIILRFRRDQPSDESIPEAGSDVQTEPAGLAE